MTRTPTRLETAVIEVATAYAVANGYEPTDRKAVGLVLAGMVIVASLPATVRSRILDDYLAGLPDAAEPMARWANYIERAS